MAEQRLTRQRWTSQVADRRYVTPTQVSRVPRVWVVDEFASSAECAHVVEVGNQVEAESLDGTVTTKHDTTGFSFEMPIAGDAVLEALDRRIEQTIGVADILGSTFRFRRYRPGEEHPPHTDVWDGQVGWLVGTAMLCLVAPDKGGSTDFVAGAPPLSLPARPGRLAVWANHRTDGTPDHASLHVGSAVLAGEKITITRFVYRNPDDDLFVRYGLPEAPA